MARTAQAQQEWEEMLQNQTLLCKNFLSWSWDDVNKGFRKSCKIGVGEAQNNNLVSASLMDGYRGKWQVKFKVEQPIIITRAGKEARIYRIGLDKIVSWNSRFAHIATLSPKLQRKAIINALFEYIHRYGPEDGWPFQPAGTCFS